MTKELFGYLKSGEEVTIVTLSNEKAELKISSLGATIVSFTPYGKDIIGGFSTLTDYEVDTSHQGATIGRVANRIAGAEFTMDGAIYMLPQNNKGNCLHGGRGFDYRIWKIDEATETSVSLSYYSEDGEEGFPGGLHTSVKFTLTDATLIIEYKAIPDGKTPIALTNHAYFNLDGFGGNVCDHVATIYADTYTEIDTDLIPNGNHPNVEGTPFDFKAPRKIGECIGESFSGYDHNFVLTPTKSKEFSKKNVPLCAVVEGKELKMSFYTDQPGVQFYTANFLRGEPDFRGGVKKIQHGAFCLEAQTEPNAVNHGECFYDAGEVYTQITVYEVEKK